MGILRMLREWREEPDGTLEGPALRTEEANIGNLDVKRQADVVKWASSYEGADRDARLDNALADANDGDKVVVENGEYNANRTIDTDITISGRIAGLPSSTDHAPTIPEGTTWTLEGRVTIEGFDLYGSIILNQRNSRLRDSTVRSSGTLTIAADLALLTELKGIGDIVFESGTADGLVDSSNQVSVTDNGTNVIGNISG